MGAGQGDRQHEQRDQQQVTAEQPARAAQVAGVLAFDHGDMELAWQAQDRGERDQRLRDEAAGHALGPDRRRGLPRAGRDAAAAGQVQHREHADRDEGQQLHQRLQRHRQHHAAVMLGGVDLAGAEQDREQRQQRRHVQRRIAQRAFGAARGQHVHAHRHRLELQREIRHRRDHRDRGHQCGQARCAAVARGQEIGDRDDALLAGNQHQPLQHAPAEQHQQQRAEVDRQECQALARGGADRAVERPRRAVHRQRQCIHQRAQARSRRRALVARVGHREQQADIAGRHQQQDPAGDHGITTPRVRCTSVAGVRAKRNPPGGGFLSWEELDTQTSVCEKMPDNSIRG